jgi:hypothetical protein
MGCYGAIKRRKCPLVAYMIFVFIIMIALGGVAYVLFSSKDALEKIEAGDKTGNNYGVCSTKYHCAIRSNVSFSQLII